MKVTVGGVEALLVPVTEVGDADQVVAVPEESGGDNDAEAEDFALVEVVATDTEEGDAYDDAEESEFKAEGLQAVRCGGTRRRALP